jgi:DsbC/DsbD-like thiol-disulfide interchange protein
MNLRAFRDGTFVSVLAGGLALAAGPDAVAEPHVKASLVAEPDAVVPGRTLALGVRLRMEAGWHTYWRNPGDAGLPTRARWTLPDGFAAGELQWPVPERFANGPVASYGYSGEVLLPVEVRVPAMLAASEVRLAARVDWLECREACLPGRAEVSLVLPVGAASRPGPSAAAFADARRRLPSPRPGWDVTATAEGSSLVLAVRPTGELPKSAYFFPLEPRVIEHGREQALERAATRRYRLRLARDPNGPPVERLRGVLAVETDGGRRALAVDVPVPDRAPARASRN